MSTKQTILVVEDESVLQDVYKIILTAGGYDVHTANNGAEGLLKIRALKPAVVLLDLFMPQMDGMELLRNIDLDDLPKTRVIVYSNLSDKTTETELLNLGAHDFILKSSMTPNDLLDLVKKHLKS